MVTPGSPLFPDSPDLRARVAAALCEDLGTIGDVTSLAVFAPHDRLEARVVAKAPGVVCGLPMAALVFGELSADCVIRPHTHDGQRVAPGQCVLEVSGPARAVLSGERTFLNFLQRLSGIATVTQRFVEAAAGRLDIVDTRKTTPLWRDLEKYAVRCGGGLNHRFGLYDMVMLKDTHVDACGGLATALERVRAAQPQVPIAAEARDLAEVRVAVDAGVDLLMLDNMDDTAIAKAVTLIGERCPTEVTGGITPERVVTLARLGIDRVSVGALTHSAPALDFSMKSRPATAAG